MSGSCVYLTDREAAAVAFIVAAALEDEEPSDVRAALIRALSKLRRTTGVSFGSYGGRQ